MSGCNVEILRALFRAKRSSLHRMHTTFGNRNMSNVNFPTCKQGILIFMLVCLIYKTPMQKMNLTDIWLMNS
ncbi:hypothetical protein BDZ45DRAFT_272414 [Acephala macrosclerotiorum]|nr:hypothetical protein BDZ45DRAFT_272414 [Acephala macrosclerotiorum]